LLKKEGESRRKVKLSGLPETYTRMERQQKKERKWDISNQINSLVTNNFQQ
jgi:hypothetical protein